MQSGRSRRHKIRFSHGIANVIFRRTPDFALTPQGTEKSRKPPQHAAGGPRLGTRLVCTRLLSISQQDYLLSALGICMSLASRTDIYLPPNIPQRGRAGGARSILTGMRSALLRSSRYIYRTGSLARIRTERNRMAVRTFVLKSRRQRFEFMYHVPEL
ncbi:hypothetical protein DFH08DRAFT_337195 [Mycena albidolilacea]|uniref:Uncharacterized protein n=1 Tax=Mycena albidolilacea TaxID=1033008 RepID=A0AAD6ZJZ8_9AGAR|nr:hypothetical protein DFH08DRAFT_337195 [Mycena albidolilacea]